MSNPHGTDWCAPGEGATIEELHDAVCGPDRWNKLTKQAETVALRNLADVLRSNWFGAKTNLRLTGRPLVAYDLERIAACEVL